MYPIANPHDHDYDRLWHMQFGAYACTHLYVWADHLESALEEACDWLADHAPGVFTVLTDEDYADAAKELGLTSGYHDSWDTVADHAERDLYVVGHTTYKGFDGQPCIPSWEWFGYEVDPTSAGYDDVRRHCAWLGEWIEVWFCQDCTLAEVSGDMSGLSDERAAEVTAGFESPDYLPDGYTHAACDADGDGEIELSTWPCHACGTSLAGLRTRFQLIPKREEG